MQNANKLINLKIGAKGSGKTYIDTAYTIPQRIIERRGKEGLVFIIGVTKETIERNVLKLLRNHYGELVGEINTRNVCRMFGEDVYCLGAEKVNQITKIQGSTAKYVYGDEVVRWHEEVFMTMLATLRTECSCMDGACNPESPEHHVKKFIDKPENQQDLYVQKYVIEDNPFYPPDKLEALKRQYLGTVFYPRYILGEWTLAEGLVYPNFANAVVPTEQRQYTEYQISCDYGTYNPTAFGLYGKADTWYKIKDWQHSGRASNVQKADDEYYKELLRFAGDLPIYRVIVDPSASSFITLIRREGKFTVKTAANAVIDGIRATAAALNTGNLKINDCCTHTITESKVYAWNSKSGTDEPIEQSDHSQDETRYFVYTNRLGLPPVKTRFD